ncbi:MAG: hypothetical protein IPK64_00200 [bacterium]|nr:hypothetical protein [bacterium]
MKRLASCALLVASTVMFAACGKDEATDPDVGVHVTVDNAALSAAPGDTIVVVIAIANAAGFRAASFAVGFDADLLAFLSVQNDTEFMGSDGISFSERAPTGVSVGVGRIGGTAADAPGEGTLARLQFRCTSEGVAEIVLDDFRIIDIAGALCLGSDALTAIRAGVVIGDLAD